GCSPASRLLKSALRVPIASLSLRFRFSCAQAHCDPVLAPPRARGSSHRFSTACSPGQFTTPPAATVAARASRGVPPVLVRQVRPVLSSLRFRGCAPICLAPLGLARRRGELSGLGPRRCRRTQRCPE